MQSVNLQNNPVLRSLQVKCCNLLLKVHQFQLLEITYNKNDLYDLYDLSVYIYIQTRFQIMQ